MNSQRIHIVALNLFRVKWDVLNVTIRHFQLLFPHEIFSYRFVRCWHAKHILRVFSGSILPCNIDERKM